jgi:hypothetical protein
VTLRAVTTGERAPFLLYLRASITGHAINEATPGGKIGELTKYSILDDALTRERAAAALVAQNLVMFVVNCGLIALAPPLAILAVGGQPGTALGFAAVGLGFLVAGAAVVFVLARGVGAWPFAVLRFFRVSKARTDRWKRRFHDVEEEWRRAAHDRRSMLVAWGSAIASRACNVAESAIYFGLAGGDHAIAGGFLALAGGQAIGWVMFFVPFGAGTAEGGAYAVFRIAGLSSSAAVVEALARKLRRVVFVAIGVALLGLSSVGKRARDRARPRRAGTADQPST